MVGDGGASSIPLGSLGVADMKVMSGTPCPCSVLGCRRTLSMSFVETARARLPRLCWMSRFGRITCSDALDAVGFTSNGGRSAGPAVEM